MTLKNFKKFYLNNFPEAKSAISNMNVTKRIKDDNFLTYFLGDVISTFNGTDISKIMNGDIPKSFINIFNETTIKNIELKIKINFENLDLDNIAQNAQKYINNCNCKKQQLLDSLINSLNWHTSKKTIIFIIKWWFIFSCLQEKSLLFTYIYIKELEYNEEKKLLENASVIDNIENFLSSKNIKISTNGMRKCAEIGYENLHTLRKILINSASKTLYISGETLGNAFSNANQSDAVIIKNIVDGIVSRRLDKINVFLMDPCILGESDTEDTIGMLKTNIIALINNLSIVLKSNNCELNIYFLPLWDIDHSIITENFLLLRSTNLWTQPRDLKGSVMLFYKHDCTDENTDIGEYNAHKKYLDTLISNSVLIDTENYMKKEDNLSKDKQMYRDIGNKIYELKKKGNHKIQLYKLYDSQLKRIAISSFKIHNSHFSLNCPSNNYITSIDDLYNHKNLLNDKTQKVLLEYIKGTETLFTKVINNYDKRSESKAKIIPSLDLGYPNNITRLAGGFATGMLIDWECGTPIIPIDATVNVCSSSVFKITHLGNNLFKNFELTIKSIAEEAAMQHGYSLNFKSGNHFLMLATDENGDYYLVMHSSAKEMKESYFGLYPTENNWFSSNIQIMNEENRYFRYIIGNDAEYFIKTAHHIEKYNEEIHCWLAKQLNSNKEPELSIVKHHYYMPTDSSIAIGTFVERPGEIVPLFSDVKKPVYLFKIGTNNWTYNLGEKKGEVCIIPHGWGQQIENIENFHINNGKLNFSLHDGSNVSYNIISTERIDDKINSLTQVQLNKRIRQFKNGEEFLKQGEKCVQGTIEKILKPQYLYCKSFTGQIKE